MDNEFTKKILFYRERKFGTGSLRRVATAIGIHYSYLHRIENGDHTPTDEVLMKLISAYDLSPTEATELFIAAHTPQLAKILHNTHSAKTTANALFRRSKKKE